jgi:hypothetical protein
MFNRVQLPVVVAELDALVDSPGSTQITRSFLVRLRELIRKYVDEPHVYLWFHGD